MKRYDRQILFQHFDLASQRRLLESRVVLIGCGALGTVLANTLVRAGVGFLRIVDRDTVEWNNLQRQVLFDERDAADGTPKAIAAAQRLGRVNSEVRVEPVIADANPGNIESLVEDVELIVDGTDNFETRYLINDVAVKHGVPWVYGACVGSSGMVMPILPGRTPCLRCIWEGPPPAGISPTCDTVGVLAPIVNVIASLQATEALKLLTGRHDDLNRKLTQIDVWTGRFDAFDMQQAFEAGSCRCCKHREYDYLDGDRSSRSTSLCGRNAVQVVAPPGTSVDLEQIAARLAGVANATPISNRYLVRCVIGEYEITLFEDGRAIIKGTSEPETARSLYARYIGA